MPVLMSPMVSSLPYDESGLTSPNPTVLMVMTVMYRESKSDMPSMKWYPVTPKVMVAMKR